MPSLITQPLSSVVVDPGQSAKVYGGALDVAGGLTRIVLQGEPVGVPFGFSQVVSLPQGEAWKTYFPFPVRAIAELRLQAKDRQRIAWLDLNTFLQVNLAAVAGEVWVYNQVYAQYPALAIANVPVRVTCALMLAEYSVELPRYTHFLSAAGPVAAFVDRFAPIQPQARRLILSPAPTLVQYDYFISGGQYISDTTAVAGPLFVQGRVTSAPVAVDIPQGGTLLTVHNSSNPPVVARLPQAFSFVVEP